MILRCIYIPDRVHLSIITSVRVSTLSFNTIASYPTLLSIDPILGLKGVRKGLSIIRVILTKDSSTSFQSRLWALWTSFKVVEAIHVIELIVFRIGVLGEFGPCLRVFGSSLRESSPCLGESSSRLGKSSSGLGEPAVNLGVKV